MGDVGYVAGSPGRPARSRPLCSPTEQYTPNAVGMRCRVSSSGAHTSAAGRIVHVRGESTGTIHGSWPSARFRVNQVRLWGCPGGIADSSFSALCGGIGPPEENGLLVWRMTRPRPSARARVDFVEQEPPLLDGLVEASGRIGAHDDPVAPDRGGGTRGRRVCGFPEEPAFGRQAIDVYVLAAPNTIFLPSGEKEAGLGSCTPPCSPRGRPVASTA